MFLPRSLLDKILLIQSSVSGTEGVALYDIKKWLHSAAKHTKSVLKKDFHTNLERAKVVGRKDLKKIERTYSGWGVMNYEKRQCIQKAAAEFARTKMVYYLKQERVWRSTVWEWQMRVSRRTTKGAFSRLMYVKQEFIEELWRRERVVMKRGLNWMLSEKGGGGVKISTIAQKEGPPIQYCPSDDYLIQKYPKVVHEPVVYGDVQINHEEKEVLSLPPKFAVMEHLNINDLKLELKRGAMKGRWHQRSEEEKAKQIENDGEALDEEAEALNDKKEIVQTSHWIKGRDEIDFTGVRPTAMKFKSRYILPGPIRSKDWEVKWNSFELEALRTASEVNEKLRTLFGKKNFLNLDYVAEKGLKQVIRKKKKGEILVVETDKSRRLAVDQVDNYSTKMVPHLGGKEVEQEEVLSIEREMNARAKVWVRILGIAEATKNGEDRVRKSVISTSGVPPTIYGLPKDHKAVNPGEEHPFRPVCSGDTGPDAKHANVISMVITPVNEEFSDESQVESTEDLTAYLAQFNEDQIKDILLDLYGTDVKALYPSLGIDKSADAVEELMEKSTINIKNIDFIELGRLMSYTVPQEKLEEKGLTNVVSKRKSSGGRKPKVTGRELDRRFSTMKQDDSIWHPPENEPEGVLVKLGN